MSELGLKLKKARIDSNLTLKQASEKTGIGYKTLNDYENGKSRPDVEKLAILCNAYETSADYFINTNTLLAKENFNNYNVFDNSDIVCNYI